MKIIRKKKITTGTRIKELLTEKKITQEQLAEELGGLSTQAVSNWVTDKSFPSRNIKVIADYFNVDVEYLKCEQVERRKSDLHKFDSLLTDERLKEIEEYKIDNDFIKLLTLFGIKTETVFVNEQIVDMLNYEIIIDGELCEIEQPEIDANMKYIISYQNTKYEFSLEEFRKYRKHIKKYSLFLLTNKLY